MVGLASTEITTGEYTETTGIAAQILEEGGCFKEASLQLPTGLTYSEWESVGRVIQRAEKAVMWWIGDWLNYGESAYGETYTQAIDETSYTYQTLADAKWASKKVEVSRRRENLSFSVHREVAPLAPEYQDYWLGKAEAEGWGRELLRSELKHAKRNQKLAEISAGNKDLSADRTYNVIYADPPWQYEFSKSDSREIENHYPTMPLEEICALPVSDIAADDCVLYMWTTSPKLKESFEVLEAWGFEYKTCAVWDKQKIGMGYYFRQQHELLLVATRGSLPAPEPATRPSSVLSYPREKHSAKPHEFYEVLEGMYGDLPKIELFCRTPRDGWSVWGNQSNG